MQACFSLPQLRVRGPALAHHGRKLARRVRTVCSAEPKAVDTSLQDGNADLLRSIPLVAGAVGIAGVLANRVLSGVAPVVTASSSQSRTDVLVIVMSAVLLLTGLQWLAVKPKAPVEVELDGEVLDYLSPTLPQAVADELRWTFQALQQATRTQALVVFYRGTCIGQLGYAARGCTPGSAAAGPICQQVMSSGSGTYLANLVLFPGRMEFAPYLPDNLQGAVVQPIGGEGAMIVGTNVQRGFSRIDQAWIALLADKLEVALEKWWQPGSGFGKK